jgi:pSer/pThr/pTyr-binding forkhead associated (FHA) protein
MTELWLKFKDEKGDDQRVLVEGSKFIIGRHSECDLSFPSGKLSRQHVKIESFTEVFIVSDCGSSNGTTLNGSELRDPVALKDGDVLNLGGGLDIETEIVSDRPKAGKKGAADEDEDSEDDNSSGGSSVSSGASSQSSAVSSSGSSSIPTGILIAAPVLAIVLLLCGGGLLFFLGGTNEDPRRGSDVTYTPTTPDDTPEKSPTPRSSSTVATSVSPSPGETTAPPTPEISDEKKKIEINSAAFLQRVALNDPTAFLKSTEIEIISPKITQIKNSSALAENFKAVKTNASQIQSLAKSKGLTPLFLAVAALTELGGNRGNPLEVAQKILPIYSDLKISLANNLADDNLLMVAAFDQGKAGKFNDLRNVLEALAKKNQNVGPREIRTIWFLKKQGKITDAEYEYALRFLAIGTIMQNPKDFGVNAEAVTF